MNEPDHLESADLARRATRAALASRSFLLVAGLVVALVVGLQLNLTFQIAHQQDTASQRAKQVQQTADLIRSCTTPSGSCYLRSQRRTGQAVASINEVVLLAATCASTGQARTYEQVKRCVQRSLPEEQRHP